MKIQSHPKQIGSRLIQLYAGVVISLLQRTSLTIQLLLVGSNEGNKAICSRNCANLIGAFCMRTACH